MTDNLRFHRLVQTFAPGAALVRAYPLTGGISARVTLLEIVHPDDAVQKVVVRQHGQADLAHNPNIAAHEFRLLKILQAAGVAAPIPIHVDFETFETPVIIAAFVDGKPDFTPIDLGYTLYQLASQLFLIHAVDPAAYDLSFMPCLDDIAASKLRDRPEYSDDSLSESRIRDVLEGLLLPRRKRSVLLHGDYWSGNILWKDGNIATIVDWEDSALGDPLADLANARLEILWAFGGDAMHTFTENYQFLANLDLAGLPFWDLYAALRPASKLSTWGLAPDVEAVMRERHLVFVEQALANLPPL